MNEESDDWKPVWRPYEDGQTLNAPGPASGYVLRDEELGDPDDPEAADARVTLEQGRVENPGYFVTATLYGWMFHTARYAGESAGNVAYVAMKDALTALADLLPYEEDGPKRIPEKTEKLTAEIAEFETRFAGEL